MTLSSMARSTRLWTTVPTVPVSVFLDEVVDQVVRVQALVGVGEQLGTLERSDGGSHLEDTSGLEGGRECGTLQGIPAGHHDDVVDRDVPERVTDTLVVLGDGQDRRDECAFHVLGVGVAAPTGCLDSGCVEGVDVELVDDRERGRGCD